MKVEDKPKYVKEARELQDSINVDSLIDDPNELSTLRKISRLIAIFTNFSYNDGQELKRLLLEFQKWSRRSTSVGTIRNRAVDMLQFISQKIEEMDIYVIDEPIKKNQDRIVSKLKNEKYWVQQNLEGKDLHIIVGERSAKQGEHIHVISDSDTGEIRFDSKDQQPSELLERVVSLVTKSGTTIGVTQKGIKTTTEFIETNIEGNPNKDIPILYATGVRRSGGSKGHFEYVMIKNIGKEIALDIHWGIRGFAYEWRPTEEPFELEASKEREVTYPISEEKVFKEDIPELNVIMEYKDVNGNAYFTRRELKQIRVSSGAFFKLKADTFHPPSILVDDGLEIVSEPIRTGDRVEATFKIGVQGQTKLVKIGLSGNLIAVLDLQTGDLLRQAILELAHRKIRKMVKLDSLADYSFTTHDLPEGHPVGFGAYVLLRDSI